MGREITFVPAAQLGQAKDPNAQEAKQIIETGDAVPSENRKNLCKFTSHKGMTRRLTIA